MQDKSKTSNLTIRLKKELKEQLVAAKRKSELSWSLFIRALLTKKE